MVSYGDIDQNVFSRSHKSIRNGRLQKGFLKTAVPRTFVSAGKYILINIFITGRVKNLIFNRWPP